jgi:hypothetical protein
MAWADLKTEASGIKMKENFFFARHRPKGWTCA